MSRGRHRTQSSRRLLALLILAVAVFVVLAIVRSPLWEPAPAEPPRRPAAPEVATPRTPPCAPGFDLYADETGQVCVRAVPSP